MFFKVDILIYTGDGSVDTNLDASLGKIHAEVKDELVRQAWMNVTRFLGVNQVGCGQQNRTTQQVSLESFHVFLPDISYHIHDMKLHLSINNANAGVPQFNRETYLSRLSRLTSDEKPGKGARRFR